MLATIHGGIESGTYYPTPVYRPACDSPIYAYYLNVLISIYIWYVVLNFTGTST